jgi:hypothetical protein
VTQGSSRSANNPGLRYATPLAYRAEPTSARVQFARTRLVWMLRGRATRWVNGGPLTAPYARVCLSRGRGSCRAGSGRHRLVWPARLAQRNNSVWLGTATRYTTGGDGLRPRNHTLPAGAITVDYRHFSQSAGLGTCVHRLDASARGKRKTSKQDGLVGGTAPNPSRGVSTNSEFPRHFPILGRNLRGVGDKRRIEIGGLSLPLQDVTPVGTTTMPTDDRRRFN